MSENTSPDVDETNRPRSDASTTDADVNVRVDDLTKIYGDDGDGVVAVEDLSIDIRRGEFLVLVGPSGCGKTTTLRTIAGLEEPTEGRIVIEEEDVTGLDPRQRDISMVFQNYALYPHKTVRGNLSFPLEVRNYPEDEIDRRVEEAAGLLSISELLDRKPSALSGGQQQRVALGRAIVREPSVFLMDEPLSNLDAKLRVQMRTELNELHKRVGKTTVYVTHDQAEAMTLGDRVTVMNAGELQQIGPPQRLYDNPVNRFVAGFIGEPPMNFAPIDLHESVDGYVAASELFEFALPDSIAAKVDAYEGSLDGLSFGLRPEDLHDVETASEVDAHPGNTFDAHVKLIEPMGSDKFLTIVPEPGSEMEFTARVSPESDTSVDGTVRLAANLKKAHIFDESTGESVTFEAED